MLEEARVAGVRLHHAIELSARRREKIGRRGTAIECGEGDERFGAVRVNFGCRKIARRGVRALASSESLKSRTHGATNGSVCARAIFAGLRLLPKCGSECAPRQTSPPRRMTTRIGMAICAYAGIGMGRRLLPR